MTDSHQLLEAALGEQPRWAVLTGAGVSAGSGIPTYRDARGTWLRNRPIQHQEFLADPAARRRYWGRSMVGWPGVRDARPNALHRALARWETLGHVECLITQNVDRLHQRAGSAAVVDLHGRLDRVRCLDCGADYPREWLQQQLERLNPQLPTLAAVARPDGDADLDANQVEGIQVVDCQACGGVLMPDVVFFGGSVPQDRVARAFAAVESADGLLVVGSSLQVYSGFRFVRHAAGLGKPVVIVNEGITRADHLATLKITDNALALLEQTLNHWEPRPAACQN